MAGVLNSTHICTPDYTYLFQEFLSHTCIHINIYQLTELGSEGDTMTEPSNALAKPPRQCG